MKMTGEQLAFENVPCPTCASKLVKRNRRGTPIMFVACDKTNKDYCPFSIGLDETLADRSSRIYRKLRRKDEGMNQITSDLQANGIKVTTL